MKNWNFRNVKLCKACLKKKSLLKNTYKNIAAICVWCSFLSPHPSPWFSSQYRETLFYVFKAFQSDFEVREFLPRKPWVHVYICVSIPAFSFLFIYFVSAKGVELCNTLGLGKIVIGKVFFPSSFHRPFFPFSLVFFSRQFWHGMSPGRLEFPPLRSPFVLATPGFSCLQPLVASFAHIHSVLLGIYYFGCDTFGAFISRKCFSRLLVRCIATANLSLKWIDSNPGSLEGVELNTREGTTCFLYGVQNR